MSNQSSFLRWAGSKRKLLPALRKYWGLGHSRYLEPFMGSAQLFFSLDISQAILSDLNPDLIEVFNQVKNHPYSVYRIISQWENTEQEYYRIRSLKPATLGINQRAARFIYLNKLCFNGLYRTNNKGEFNVPYSKSKSTLVCSLDLLKEASRKLAGAKILQGDFEKIIQTNVQEGDFVYLDPPYAVENRRIFRQYGPQTFGTMDMERLKNLLFHIQGQDAKFLLSYADCVEARDIFRDWDIKKTFAQRNIAGFAQFRRKEAELLISNI
jgi:DNA adenine methylase